ncbi:MULTISPECIES: hypothetical protein [Actinosynnema]|uniref:hypothetical protein n=1 Tax=Actinosynnema TaxID=40566 RepID=UPI0020A5CD93|nr:hypothetical protein [Actinosynnema pretiosum]MCP2094765.1 hypothetical protein [Actinosynnema pretiosum]
MDLTGTATAIVLSAASALAYAAGAVRQQRLAHLPGAVLARTSAWWWAIALNGVGGVLHVAALPFGPLVLVQSLGVLTVVFAVLLGALARREAVGRAEWGGSALVGAGLVAVLLVVGTGSGAGVLSGGDLGGLLVVTGAVLVLLGWGNAGGLRLAAAGGIAFGVLAALLQTTVLLVSGGGVGALLHADTALVVPGVLVLVVAAVLLTQRSYRHGLGAPLSVSTTVNPLTAAVVGVVLLGERVGGEPGDAVLALLAALAIAGGVHLLSLVPAGAPAARSRAEGEQASVGAGS